MAGCWVRTWEGEDGFEWATPEAPSGEVWVTDNEVVAELLGPNGEVVSRLMEREPIGYRLRES